MALIQANRESIDDRFSVLGFTVRTENPLFEIALAAHPDLLKGANRAKRTAGNFFSSRLLGGTRRGEAVYLVPPNVVARFVGQPRLYFGLATYREGDRSRPVSVRIPDAGSMYVNTSGLTERGLRRTARGNGAVSYGDGGEVLAWGGDALAAPAEAAPAPARDGNHGAPAPAAPPPYSDGYSDELWKQDHAAPQPPTPVKAPAPPAPASAEASPPQTASAAPAPALGSGGAPAVTALAYGGRRERGAPAQAYAKPLLVEPYDQPSSWWDALTVQLGHFARGAMWFLGVTDTTRPPYSAICQVRRPDGTAEGAHMGTAFFIGPRLLLTAGHVVDGQSELIIVPGKNGGGTGSAAEPFGRFRATEFRQHGAYGRDGHDNDMALIRVPAANAASAPNYFGLVEELTQSRPEGVVVSGYAAWWHATSAIAEFVNNNIDENRQHAHGGYIRELPTEGTFTYDLQTLAGTSGSPVYWIEDGGAPRAHLVGVHVAANDDRTNRGCRITQEKLLWIRATAAAWGQSLTFSLGAPALDADARRARAGAQSPAADAFGRPTAQAAPDAPALPGEAVDDAGMRGIEAPIPDEAATGQGPDATARAMSAPGPEYPQATRFVPAHGGNYSASPGPRAIERIVIHITDGGASINGTVGWFQNPAARVSAHYVIGQDGEIVQMVRHNDVAWHARSANRTSIGIEHVANTRGLNPTPAQLSASAALVTWLCDTFGIPVDRSHILGHSEADPGTTHSGCPNAVWDWAWYMGMIESRTSYAPDAAAQALETRVPDDGADYPVQLIPQPDKNACWAAAMAMLCAFRRNLSLTPETLAADVGASLAASYGWDLLQAVRDRYGFEMISHADNTSAYHSPQQWADWLAAFGPLWVVIVGAPHAVLLAGIRGNLADPPSVQVKILNPWDTRVAFDNDPVAFNPRNGGYEDWLPFEQFAADFGNMAQPDYGNWRVLHLPSRAAGAKSLGTQGNPWEPSLQAPNPAAGGAADATTPAADGEPIEPTRVTGTVMRVLRGGAGACRWSLDRLAGLKAPGTSTASPVAAVSGEVVIDLDDWPAVDGAATPLPVRVVFHHTAGGDVGHVRTEAGTPASLGYGAEVTARIEDTANVGGVAALRLVVDYRFSGLAQGNPVARTELRLLGDGRYERVSRWM